MSATRPRTTSALGSVEDALGRLLEALGPVEGTEAVALDRAVGRVLAEAVRADRPSPPADVSAMDGYAVRVEELRRGPLPVAGEAEIGRQVRALEPGTALRIFTGGPVPRGSDTVVKREDVEEAPDRIRLRVAEGEVAEGDHIRLRGENVAPGQVVVEAGREVRGPVAGALAAFGAWRPVVRRRVRVAVLATGDELVGADEAPSPTGLRDSNGPALSAMLRPHAWVEAVSVARVADDPVRVREAVEHALAGADALLVSGGVSMGDHDHVPEVLEQLGARLVFHRLAIKPGKPVLGAVGPGGELVMGLPGNPVSVLVTGRRLALPALRRRAGLVREVEADGHLEVDPPLEAPHPLTRFPIVRRAVGGLGEPVPSKGSGDLVAAGRSDGFVEVPAGVTGRGPFDFFAWGGT